MLKIDINMNIPLLKVHVAVTVAIIMKAGCIRDKKNNDSGNV